MDQAIRVGIVGGTGYTGVELLRLLSQHPAARIVSISSRAEAGTRVDAYFPSLRGHVDLSFVAPTPAPGAAADVAADRCDVVFFATPHGVAMHQARALVDAGVRIIDLGADFRLRDPAAFERWYKMPHACPDLLEEAVYGLPETSRAQLRRTRIAAMPGCYPTSVQLGLLPLLELERAQPGTIDTASIIADCKSGVSGAGRKAEVSLLLAEAADNFKPYGLAGHRHHPEMVQQLERIAGGPVGLVFVAHLLPTIRGILATIYVRLKPAAAAMATADLQKLYERRYTDEPFVDVMPPSSAPETRSVRGSNVARIALHRAADNLLTVFVVEDNLVKGASGQAVQAMNIMFGRAETEGLAHVPLVP
jgi:N-acetyl-gamma-glutamyl-phosphate reductase